MGEISAEGEFPSLPGRQPDTISIEWWERAHEEMLRLCSELEAIADSLPASINRQKCIFAAQSLGPLIKGVHVYEENVLFPAFEKLAGASPDLPKTLSRLKFEHFEDECFAEELVERLLLLGAGRDDVNMEATGYMLRGFFEAVRRHVAFEREHLLKAMRREGPLH